MTVRVARVGAVIGEGRVDAAGLGRLEGLVEEFLRIAVEEILAAEPVDAAQYQGLVFGVLLQRGADLE